MEKFYFFERDMECFREIFGDACIDEGLYDVHLAFMADYQEEHLDYLKEYIAVPGSILTGEFLDNLSYDVNRTVDEHREIYSGDSDDYIILIKNKANKTIYFFERDPENFREIFLDVCVNEGLYDVYLGYEADYLKEYLDIPGVVLTKDFLDIFHHNVCRNVDKHRKMYSVPTDDDYMIFIIKKANVQ